MNLKKIKEDTMKSKNYNCKALIDRYANALKVDESTKEEACEICAKAGDNALINKENRKHIAATCLYIACRHHKNPYGMDEIAFAARVKEIEIRHTYRLLSWELDIRQAPISPADYIPRYSSILKLTPEAQSKAIEIIEKAIEKKLTLGKNPKGVAGAAIYLAFQSLGGKISKEMIAGIAGITVLIINLRCNELAQFL